MSDVSPPQAGWYADPENPAGERWWNGTSWSEHRRDVGSAAPVAAPVAVDSAVPPIPPVPVPPVAAPPLVAPAADATGFTFGSATGAAGTDVRPDPYAPPPPAAYAAYGGAPAVYAPYGAPAYGGGTNGLALAGVLVSSVGWLVIPLLAPIAGIILSAFGLSNAKKRELAGNPNTGRSMAMAGLIVGIIIGGLSLLGVIAYIALIISVASSSSF